MVFVILLNNFKLGKINVKTIGSDIGSDATVAGT